jgi:alanine racemase
LYKGQTVSYGSTYIAESDRKVATIPLGYGDGYPRGLSSKGYLLICGKRAPIIGRICMDQFMVDVTDIPEAKEGDKVTLVDTDNDENVTVEQLAAVSGRFHYELVCDLNQRLPRVYIREQKLIVV